MEDTESDAHAILNIVTEKESRCWPKLLDALALLDAAGIDPDKLFEIQLVEDCHQIQATEELLRRSAASNGHPTITGDLHGIIVDGRTIWVCRKCHECLQKGHPLDDRDFLTLPQYIPLISIGPEVRVTLQNALSVTLLTKSLSRTSKTKKLIIHIDSRYFEAPERAEQTKSNSITNLFVNLGQAVQRQKDLVHLEIHGNSESDKIYDGLNAVFNCRSLEILRVSGIRILQGKNIKMRCRKLKELSLHRVPLNVEQTAKRLWKLVGVSSALVRLKLTQVRFTTDTLSMNKSKETLTQFTRLESLDLSSNDLEGQEAADLVRMALSGDNPKLRWLDLSGNKKIGKNGCQRVLGLLVGKKCWLDKFKMEGTSIDLRDSHAISTYLSFWRHEM
ncbi:hypothetical protein BGX31_003939 [Mortierella sp. GBA43]|nr:hypothetical protein BGX31_003939 [Mortierella sp. GBA43]